MIEAIWKIRRKSDGLYSNCKGFYGITPRFEKNGMAYYSEKRLINHLAMIDREIKKHKTKEGKRYTHPYLNCEIVKFQTVEEVAIPFQEYAK